MAHGLLKDIHSLNETHETLDLFDFSGELIRLEQLIRNIKSSSILALLGEYGTGKSTLIHQLKLKHSSENGKLEVIYFDAWKYPDRERLWENFLFDLSLEISGKRKEKNERKKTLGFFDRVSLSFGIKGFAEIGLSQNRVPQNRLYEIQEEVAKQLRGRTKRLITVIEDIDRSGDNGKYFLETLKWFVDKYSIDNTLFIIPMSKTEFKKEENYRSYEKSIEYKFEFSGVPSKFNTFLETIFATKFTKEKESVDLISSFLHSYYFSNREQTTIRTLKRILREANNCYINIIKKYPNADWRVILPIEFMKNAPSNPGEGTAPAIHFSVANKRIGKDTIWGSYFYALATRKTSVYEEDGRRLIPESYISIVKFKESELRPLPFYSKELFDESNPREVEWKIDEKYFL